MYFVVGALPHRFISEFDFRPLKFKLLPLATEILDNVRPRSTVGGSAKRREFSFWLILFLNFMHGLFQII